MEEKAEKRKVLEEDAHETQGVNTSCTTSGLGARLGWAVRFKGAGVAARIPKRAREQEAVGAEPPPAPSWVPVTPRGITGVSQGLQDPGAGKGKNKHGGDRDMHRWTRGTRIPSQPTRVGAPTSQHPRGSRAEMGWAWAQAYRHPQLHKPHRSLFTQQRMFQLFYGGG